jgi:hypothetical protein
MKPLLIVGCAFALAGCAKDPAAYLAPGPGERSITVERIKPAFWQSGWELNVIPRNGDICQRRHVMKRTNGDKVRVELYQPEPAVYILRQGKRWYVTELRKCEFQAYAAPPPEPGNLLGAFEEKGGAFKFVESKDNATRANGGETE